MSYEEGEEYAKSKKMLFFEASAKTADHVREIFEEVSRKLGERVVIDKPRKLEHPENKKITMSAQGSVGQQGQKGYCC